MSDTKLELHDKAWELLEEKGLTIGERMMVRTNFASMHIDEYPHILMHQFRSNNDDVHYTSSIDAIKSLSFKTEQEVILVNAMYENVKNDFNMNTFMHSIKFVFRLLNINSGWAQ